MYDLLPLPFLEEAVHHVSQRIMQVQNVFGRRIAVENISYYCATPTDMCEIDFINAVLNEADCELLLDINNVYVNSVNHGYDPLQFLRKLNPKRIAYIHVAGHHIESPTLLIDTHADAVCDPVWKLLSEAYQLLGVKPTILERDSDFPAFHDLICEVKKIQALQQGYL